MYNTCIPFSTLCCLRQPETIAFANDYITITCDLNTAPAKDRDRISCEGYKTSANIITQLTEKQNDPGANPKQLPSL